MKRFLSWILVLCMLCTQLTLPATVSAATVSSDEEIRQKIDELYTLLGNTYFNTNRNGECGEKSSGHGCDCCLTSNIVITSWFKNMFGNVSTSQFPITYCWETYLTRAAMSCAGFGSFAEWYIFKSSTSDTVNTVNIGTYNFTVENVQEYAKPGDLIRFNAGGKGSASGHSGIFINATSTGMYILDCNGDGKGSGYYNCRVAKRNFVPSSTYKTFSISRAENRVVYQEPVHQCSYTYKTEAAHPHNTYKKCSVCDTKINTGKSTSVSCKECYPLGNVSLQREFVNTKKTVTFSRNNVTNATSYTLEVYNNDGYSKEYSMPERKLTVTVPDAGTYFASLKAKNSKTGEVSKPVTCKSFTILNTYKIDYDANGGTGAPSAQTKTEGVPLDLATQVPSKTHYVFKGWAASKNDTKAKYQPGGIYNRNANATLWAVWQPETYTVSFDANGGTGELENLTVIYGEKITLPNSVLKNNYYLKGWSEKSSATEADYKPGAEYKPEKNAKLYAVWGKSTWNGDVSANLTGDGSEENPYLISSAADIAYLAQKVNSQTSAPAYEYYRLTDNINMNYVDWVPIGLYGNQYQYFEGELDGNGFTISDLFINNVNEGYVGLFGYAKNSNIENLTVKGTIENISTSGQARIGVFAGAEENSTLTGLSSAYFNISALTVGTSDFSNVGGIVGFAKGGLIENCKALETHIDLKSGKFEAGLIVGKSQADITNCSVKINEGGLFSTQPTVGEVRIGGICGNLSETADKCTVYAPYFSNNIKTTTTSNIGGIVGYLSGKVKVSSSQFSDLSVDSIAVAGTGSIQLGGVAGYATGEAEIADCKFDGSSVSSTTTSGNTYVGGIVGEAYAKTNPAFTVQGRTSFGSESLPKREGYVAEWYSDAAMTIKYDFTTDVTKDTTIYAKWSKGDNVPDIWDKTSTEPAYDAATKTYTITNGKELFWVSGVSNGDITSGANMPTSRTFSGYKINIANDIYLNDMTLYEKNGSLPNRFKSISQDEDYQFSGTFEGNKHYIYGLNTTDPSSNEGDGGLFGYIGSSGYVYRINLSKGKVRNSGDVGAIANCNYGKIQYCNNIDVGVSGGYAGGIVGCNFNDVYDCSNFANVSAGGYAGGIAAETDGYIYYCYNSGEIKNAICSGGIAGNMNKGRIRYCRNTGNVYSNTYAGGIMGGLWSNSAVTVDIRYCQNTGDVDSYQNEYESSFAGGIVGGLNITGTNYIKDNYSRCSLNALDAYGLIGKLTNFNASAKLYLTGNYSNKSSKYNSSNFGGTLEYENGNSTMSEVSAFANDSSIYSRPYITSLKETYKTYNITTVVDTEDSYAINRSFANVDGSLSGNANYNASVGGVIGYTTGGASASSKVENAMIIAGGINSTTSGSSYNAFAGNIVGRNTNGYFSFNNAYYNTEMQIDSSSSTYDTTGTARSKSSMNTRFFTTTMGLGEYISIENLEEDEVAVWVLADGEMPELYYNCLNEITISDEIINGEVSVDKPQATANEDVKISVVPDEGYVLNKIYVNGEELDGETFNPTENSVVYVTFAEEIPEYSISITTTENVNATLTNVDENESGEISLMAATNQSSLVAQDGQEIQVTTIADENFAVDAIYVNGEAITGTSFILNADSVVTLDVVSIDTTIKATTYDVQDLDSYSATLSGSVQDIGENGVKYISYWKTSEPETVFVTEIQEGSGEYMTEVQLEPSTSYSYRMLDCGEVKTFTTNAAYVGDSERLDNEEEPETKPITSTTYKTLTSTHKFTIVCETALENEALMVACYDANHRVIAADIIECDGDTTYNTSFPKDLDIAYVKIFVWEGFDNMKPLGGVEKIEM